MKDHKKDLIVFIASLLSLGFISFNTYRQQKKIADEYAKSVESNIFTIRKKNNCTK